jgi:ankyrin repeat protein
MGKRKSKDRSAPALTKSMTVKTVSEADIIEACRAGDLFKLQRLKRQGVRIATADPLIYAARGGFVALVRCLTQEFGVDVNQKNDDGWNALLIAA